MQMGATGLLVDARSEGDQHAVQHDAGGLTVTPVAATWLATRLQQLGSAVLPLLIRPDGVLTQQPELGP